MRTAYALMISIMFFTAGNSFSQEYVDLVKMEQNGWETPSFVREAIATPPYSESQLDILLPFPLSKKLALLTGINASTMHFQETTSGQNHRFHAVFLKAGINVRHSDRWSASYLILPRLSSEQLNGNNSGQLGGFALFKYNKSQQTKLKLGAYVNGEFFGPLIVPILGLYHKSTRWEVNLNLPINGELAYQFGQSKIRMGARFEGINRSYRMPSAGNAYLEKTNNEASAFIEKSIGRIVCQLHAGHSFWRSFTGFTDGEQSKLTFPLYRVDDDRVQLFQEANDAPFVKLSLIYRLPIKP
ncbi:MAG: DUF6268 family outer membrane beta-barrel protein [Salibacteraceae bacterium]